MGHRGGPRSQRPKIAPPPIREAQSDSDGPSDKAGVCDPSIGASQSIEIRWTAEERQLRRKERFYWGLTAVLTFIAVIGAIATVVLSQLSLLQARKSVREASHATIEARRQADAVVAQLAILRAEQRPILQIESTIVPLPIRFTQFGAYLQITFNIKNIGHDLAQATHVRGEFYARTDNTVINRQRAACATEVQNPTGGTQIGFTIFSGSYQITSNLTMTADDLEKWTVDAKKTIRTVVPMLVGCVDYIFDGTHHQTPFVFEIDKRGGVNGFGAIDPAAGDVPADQVLPAIPPWFVGEFT